MHTNHTFLTHHMSTMEESLCSSIVPYFGRDCKGGFFLYGYEIE